MGILVDVINAIKDAGFGYISVGLAPVLDGEKKVVFGPDGSAQKEIRVMSKPGEMLELNKALSSLNLPHPLIVRGEAIDDDRVFSLYNLEKRTLSRDQLESAARMLDLRVSESTIDDLAYIFDSVEEPLISNLTFDDAVEIKDELESALGVTLIIMIQCEGCQAAGLYTNDTVCICCDGRGVQYLPEAE